MNSSSTNYIYSITTYIKEHKRQLLFILLGIGGLILLLSLNTTPIFADVGNNNSYSGSGSSGSSGSSSGGSYSSGVNISVDIFQMFFYYMVNRFGAIGIVFSVIIMIFLIFVFLFVSSYFYSKGNYAANQTQDNNNSYHHSYQKRAKSFDLKDIREVVPNIKAIDPDFSEEDMKQKATECFITLQNAWTERNWEKVRPFESDALFAMHSAQLNEYIRNKTINVVERINVAESQIIDFKIDGDMEVIQIEMWARMRDYIISEKTNKVLEGNPNMDIYQVYRLEFIRKHGVKTQRGKELATTNCPNCGAPTRITSSGKCEYCDSVITNGNFSWVLNELTAMA